jgi:hypothetical protein
MGVLIDMQDHTKIDPRHTETCTSIHQVIVILRVEALAALLPRSLNTTTESTVGCSAMHAVQACNLSPQAANVIMAVHMQ